MGLIRNSPVGTYQFLHINALGTAVAVGTQVNTTATTAVAAPGSVTITPASMANIHVGDWLNVFGGTGTAEYVQVSATTATTFTATFANTHSGTYSITSRRGTYLGYLTVNQAGSAITITLYNGNPSESPDTGGGVIAAISPVAGASYQFLVEANRGLYYTVAGTTAGDYTISFLDMPAN